MVSVRIPLHDTNHTVTESDARSVKDTVNRFLAFGRNVSHERRGCHWSAATERGKLALGDGTDLLVQPVEPEVGVVGLLRHLQPLARTVGVFPEVDVPVRVIRGR